MLFLATPYTDEKLSVMQRRYEEALEMASHLAKIGFVVYCPIVSWHVAAVKYNLPFDFNYWRLNSRTFINCCETFAIGKIEGWDKSTGVKDEYDYATLLKKNTVLINSLSTPVYGINFEVEECRANPFTQG
jgi:hypothetical protein